MPIYRPDFVPGELYHVINRGVDKRTIFCDEYDYLRFVQGLYEFNNRNAVTIWGSSNLREAFSQVKRGEKEKRREREELVEICGFCLMPNHFHLLLRVLSEDGIPLFMKKNGTGFTTYFNLKYKRSGCLFQGPYKIKHIDNDLYMRQVFGYVHLNPSEFVEKNWKEGIKNWSKTEKFLRGYRWSSFVNYFDDNGFPVINSDFFSDVLGNKEEMLSLLKNWVADNELHDLT